MLKLTLPTDRRGRIILALKAIGLVLALWLAAALVYRVVFLPREAKRDQAEAVVQQQAAQATAAIATESAVITREIHREHVRIDETTRRNDHAIKSAAGAETRVPAVAAALRRSLCQRASHLDQPDCAALLGDD